MCEVDELTEDCLCNVVVGDGEASLDADVVDTFLPFGLLREELVIELPLAADDNVVREGDEVSRLVRLCDGVFVALPEGGCGVLIGSGRIIWFVRFGA